jgi:hypothetical protein
MRRSLLLVPLLFTTLAFDGKASLSVDQMEHMMAIIREAAKKQ